MSKIAASTTWSSWFLYQLARSTTVGFFLYFPAVFTGER